MFVWLILHLKGIYCKNWIKLIELAIIPLLSTHHHRLQGFVCWILWNTVIITTLLCLPFTQGSSSVRLDESVSVQMFSCVWVWDGEATACWTDVGVECNCLCVTEEGEARLVVYYKLSWNELEESGNRAFPSNSLCVEQCHNFPSHSSGSSSDSPLLFSPSLFMTSAPSMPT